MEVNVTDEDWKQVAAGSSHTCAVKTDGRPDCWGAGGDGRLGNSGTADSLVPVQESAGAMDWAQVSGGGSHTCAVKTDGRLFCWGAGGDGRLGNSGTANSLVPVQESTGATNWAQVSAGGLHTCGLKTDGRLFCWGSGSSGQLGSDSVTVSGVPVQESTGATDWAQVSAGGAYTCGLKTDGRLFCWGAGSAGRLGNNATENSWVPVQEWTEATDWAQVSAGSAHVCAVKTDGRLFCWGYGLDGRLGNNAMENSPVPVQESTEGTNWAQVSGGVGNTCAVKTDGRLFCWGYGVIGLGNNGVSSVVPVQESTEGTDWAQVSGGSLHTCAVKTDGRLFCWGAGAGGRLGNNGTVSSPVPAQEWTEATDWAQVSGGGSLGARTRVR